MGHKPFRCPECNYRCNNKSMLNSHKKSHSNDYPYRCGVCNYAAKYRHALNIHLRKKRHYADGEVILEDGHRYGRSRNRGGKTSRNLTSEGQRHSSPHEEIVGLDVAWQQESQHDCGMTDYVTIVKQEPDSVNHSVNTSYLHAVHKNAVYALSDSVQPSLVSMSDLSNVQLMRYSPVVYPPGTATTVADHNGVVLSQGRHNNPARGDGTSFIPSTSISSASSGDQDHSSIYETSPRLVRLSPARRFPVRGSNYRTVDANLEERDQHDGLPLAGIHRMDAIRDCIGESGKEWPLDLTAKPRRNTSTENSNNHRNSWGSLTEKVPRQSRYECQHCGIIFPDRILYSMHMEYHGQSDPFQCNLCGQRTQDRREFYNHINQVAHKSAI